MSPDARTKLLQALQGLTYRDAEQLDPWSTFLPLSVHRRALHPDCVVVLGNRGSGKTALFTLVRNAPDSERLRQFFEDGQIPDATWIDAFSQIGVDHPEVSALEHQASRLSDTTLRIFWLAHLLRRVHATHPDLLVLPAELAEMLACPVADVDTWLPRAETHAGMLTAALDAIEGALSARGHTLVAAYDTLDRIAQFDRDSRRRFISTLLALWLSLASRYRRLRGKIFLREDLFEASELRFPDATKLRPRAVSLEWGHADLFRVLVRHLATDPDSRAWLLTVKGLELRDRGEFGWQPGEMPERVQQALATQLAGASVGKGVLKTSTARWILSRLEDAHARITPRSLLWFFGFAAQSALKTPRPRTGRPLSAVDLLPALRATSGERVSELCEEYQFVRRVENLRAMKLPLTQALVQERLARPGSDPPLGPHEDGEALVRELERLGVLKKRPDGKLDLPDIYRYAFDITPNYGEAWQQYIQSAAPEASAQLIRELPELAAILANAPWDTIGGGEDAKTALAECHRALELAMSVGNKPGEAALCSTIGSLLIQAGSAEEGLEHFQRAAEIFRERGDRGQLAMVLTFLLLVATKLQRQDIREDIRLQLHGDPNLATICMVAMGSLFEDTYLPERIEMLMTALGQWPKDPQFLPFRGLAFVTLAGIAERVNKVDHALVLTGIASKIAEVTDPAEPKHQTFLGNLLPQEKTLLSVMAERLALPAERVEKIQRQADELYDRDGGWSALQAAFPDPSKPGE